VEFWSIRWEFEAKTSRILDEYTGKDSDLIDQNSGNGTKSSRRNKNEIFVGFTISAVKRDGRNFRKNAKENPFFA
jgi:hypothetical protein